MDKNQTADLIKVLVEQLDKSLPAKVAQEWISDPQALGKAVNQLLKAGPKKP